MQALQQDFSGRIKCIYIDPPYNTGSAFDYYDDNLEHSIWLNLMKQRLELLRELLSEDGSIWIQIDDEEQAYLKILCDEVFGRSNFVNMISVNMKNIAGVSGGGEDKRLKKNCEYILVYAKEYSLLPLFNGPYMYTEISELVQQYQEEGKSWKYTTVLVDPGEKKYVGSTIDGDGNDIEVYLRLNPVMAFTTSGIKTFVEVSNPKTQMEIYQEYLRMFTESQKKKKTDDPNQMTMFDYQPDVDPDNPSAANSGSSVPAQTATPSKTGEKQPLSQEEFVKAVTEYSVKAISVPKILVQTNSEVKFNRFQVKRTIPDFEVAMAKIERFDAINQQLLTLVDAQILEVNDAMNTLACMLLDSISELSYDDADFVIDIVEQYLSQIDGDEEAKRRIVRRYATIIVSDLKKQIYEHMDKKTQDVHIVQKDLIVFRKFVKNVKEDGKVKYDKPFTDKSNIKKYLFTGYKKSYYPANAFDSDTERQFSIILEEDPDVIRWIKPPLNQLGLFWKAGQQYNPDFLVETSGGKFMYGKQVENFERLMSPYDQPHTDNEKPTLQSMREVESSANMYYYTEE